MYRACICNLVWSDYGRLSLRRAKRERRGGPNIKGKESREGKGGWVDGGLIRVLRGRNSDEEVQSTR